jgi:polyisoprenoid-binding protein YceI
MKKSFLKIIMAAAIATSFLTPVYAADNYTIDSSHSYVLWHISHFGFSNPSGKWLVNGNVVLDEKNPKNSKVNITIDMSGIITGIPKLDEHLKKDVFFDVEKYPTATFVSDKVTLTGKHTAKVHGVLTVHGVSKPVTLDIKLNKLDVSPITEKKTAGFTGSTTLKRSDYNITTYLPGLGDEVKIEIEAEANKAG